MCRSAPEVVKIAEEAFASLVLDGTLPAEASGALLDGLKDLLLRYAEAVTAQLSCDCLVPPLPPLVRYKREVLVKAEAVGAGRTPTFRLVSSVSWLPAHAGLDIACACNKHSWTCNWGRSRHRHHEEEEPSPAQQEADRRCAALTPRRIGTLLNSLMYIKRQFPAWSQCALKLLWASHSAVTAPPACMLRRACEAGRLRACRAGS